MSPWQQAWSGIGPIERIVSCVGAGPARAQSTHREHRGQHDVAPSETPSTTSAEGAESPAPTSDDERQEARWPARTAVIGYASIEAGHPEGSSADLQRQAREIASGCERRDLDLIEVVHDSLPTGQRPPDQPGLDYALERIAAGEARGLVVSELFRLSHALPELGRILEWLTARDVRLIAVVPNIDTREEAGALAVRTIIELSGWERQRLAERTRAGMRAARSKGPASVSDDPELRDRIAAMRASGMTLQAIANRLNADGIPTLRGGAMWRPSSVQAAAGYQRPSTTRVASRQGGNPEPAEPDETTADEYPADDRESSTETG